MTTTSATPTIVEDRSETSSVNEEFQHHLFPGPEEQKEDPYLVEFDPGDPLNPKVRHRRLPLNAATYVLPVLLYRTGHGHTDGILQCSVAFSF